MPGTLTSGLSMLALAALAAAIAGERRLQRVDWARLHGRPGRWSDPETRLVAATAAAAITAAATITAAGASYGMELYRMACAEPDAGTAVAKLWTARAHTIFATSATGAAAYICWRVALAAIVRITTRH